MAPGWADVTAIGGCLASCSLLGQLATVLVLTTVRGHIAFAVTTAASPHRAWHGCAC